MNATLNALAAVLLVVGVVLIRRGSETAHKWTMITCFAVSVIFLACYLGYHQMLHEVTGTHGKQFEHPVAAVRYFYYAILISHVILAAAVPFLAVATIYLGIRDRRQQHRRLAKWTFPIWLYVSITGVAVYLLLYWL